MPIYIHHGVLHLIGYVDKTKEEKMIMTDLENKFLETISSDGNFLNGLSKKYSTPSVPNENGCDSGPITSPKEGIIRFLFLWIFTSYPWH